MKQLQPQITRQATLGLFLCLSAWGGLLVAPSATSAALAFLSVILFWSQLNFAKAHAAAEQAQSSTQAAFEAFPDAVIVARADATVGFQKDVVAPRVQVLPALVKDGKLLPSELVATVFEVLAARASKQVVVRLADGRVFECRGTPFKPDEVLIIARDITESHKDSERIRYLATHDGLTGLLNRNSFHVSLEQAITRANRSKRPFGLLFLDLDHFKAVNDTLGHEAGDKLLKEVSQRLRSSLRQSDSAYRLAGDEFTVLVEGLDSEKDVFLVAEKVCATLAVPYFDDPGAPAVTASVGAVVYPRDGATADELLRLADKAMYQAKAQGRNNAAVHGLTVPA